MLWLCFGYAWLVGLWFSGWFSGRWFPSSDFFKIYLMASDYGVIFNLLAFQDLGMTALDWSIDIKMFFRWVNFLDGATNHQPGLDYHSWQIFGDFFPQLDVVYDVFVGTDWQALEWLQWQ